MAITVRGELELKLRQRAEAAGLTLDSYVEELLRDEDAEITHTEALLSEAAASGGYGELDGKEGDRLMSDALAAAKSGDRTTQH
jgi:hypothetical protein